ncbi:CDGSH iron-sulfur domain-containing protein [Nonomuraea sediminis]|uniref:CDGSH iron-sulfur domain-containing protein n=1 Tax=Nonomuraea sediminis TaxID=2835864 RepID=UPI001BDD4590|nr:CDGSH iron-sulfur domain-containing protein [Nonomuraea sediminis]
MRIEVTPNGPYSVSGSVPIRKQIIGTDERGQSVSWVEGEAYPARERYELCRCGHSRNKPFCDGTHATIGFTDG